MLWVTRKVGGRWGAEDAVRGGRKPILLRRLFETGKMKQNRVNARLGFDSGILGLSRPFHFESLWVLEKASLGA